MIMPDTVNVKGARSSSAVRIAPLLGVLRQWASPQEAFAFFLRSADHLQMMAISPASWDTKRKQLRPYRQFVDLVGADHSPPDLTDRNYQGEAALWPPSNDRRDPVNILQAWMNVARRAGAYRAPVQRRQMVWDKISHLLPPAEARGQRGTAGAKPRGRPPTDPEAPPVFFDLGRFRRDGVVQEVTYDRVTRAVHDYCTLVAEQGPFRPADFTPPDQLRGHGCRAGGAAHGMDAGLSATEIRSMGHWADDSPTVFSYLRACRFPFPWDGTRTDMWLRLSCPVAGAWVSACAAGSVTSVGTGR